MYKSFEDLKAWQLAKEFRKAIYQIGKSFQKSEQYALTSQIQRAAIDEKYITQTVFDKLYNQGKEVEKVLNGYIGYLERQKPK